jgi:hypothetical protein
MGLGGSTPAMLSGFNTNIRHRGVLFHVQTEDSGKANPHVITHLFHGGNIMASEKREYSGQLEVDDLASVVKGLMEEQHKAMLHRLRSGRCDDAILARLGKQAFDDLSETESTRPDRPEPEPKPSPEAPAQGTQRAFGERIVSAKPLDEVVLDYLFQNARKRKRSSS